jgi:hypothetical protein
MALHLDTANSQTVDFGNLAYMNNQSTLTICIWMKKDVAGGRVVINKGNSSTSEMAILCNTDGIVYFIMRNGSAVSATVTLDDDLWHHYAMVFDGAKSGDARCLGYIDCVDQSLSWSAAPAATTPTNTRSFFTGLFERSSLYGDGDYAEPRIYSEALASSQIITDCTGFRPEQPQGHWSLGVSSPEADYSGNNNPGTRVGTPVLPLIAGNPPIGDVWGEYASNEDGIGGVPVSGPPVGTLSMMGFGR